VVIGVQDTDANKESERGLESVFRLTDKDIEKCKEYNWEYLTQDMIDLIGKEKTKKAKEMAKSLQDIIDQEFEELDEGEEENEGEEEEEEDGENEEGEEENEVEEEDDGNEEDDQEEEVEEKKKAKKKSESVYYTINVPCTTEEDEECMYEVPCKFKNKESFLKIKKIFNDSESKEFDDICSKFNDWLENNTDDGSCVSDCPTVENKLTGKEKEDFLELE